jgi:hypothetical protein
LNCSCGLFLRDSLACRSQFMCNPVSHRRISSLLCTDVALVNGPCFSSSDQGSLDLVIFYCQTFPWGLEHRTGRWTTTSQTYQTST